MKSLAIEFAKNRSVFDDSFIEYRQVYMIILISPEITDLMRKRHRVATIQGIIEYGEYCIFVVFLGVLYSSFASLYLFADLPNTQVPPLTPGTNQKMTQALAASFKLFEREQQRLGIPRGMY